MTEKWNIQMHLIGSMRGQLRLQIQIVISLLLSLSAYMIILSDK